MMLGAGSELAVTHGAHLPAERLFAHRDTELLPQPLGQIAQTSAHDTVEIGRRSPFDGLCQGRPLNIVQQ